MATIGRETAQQIVETVKNVCGYDINFISTNGIIIASTDRKRIGDYHEIGFQASVKKETIEVYEDNAFDGTLKGINIPFVYYGAVHGVIGITGEVDEVKKYARLAIQIMRILLKEKDLDTSREMKRAQFSYVVRALTKEEPISHEYLLQFMQEKKLKYHGTYRVVAIRIKQNENITVIENQIEQALSEIRNAFYAYEYPESYNVIIAEEAYPAQKEFLEKICMYHARIGIGTVQKVNHLARSYEDALLALKISSEDFVVFDMMRSEFLFSALPASLKETYTKNYLGKLNDKELHILRIYLDNNMSLKESAEKLFVHKNTLQYQLDKIAEKTRMDPRVFKDAVSYWLALHLQQQLYEEEGR